MFSFRRIALTSRFGGVPAVVPRPMVSIKQSTSPAIHIQPTLRPYSSSSSSKPSNPSDGASGSNIAGTPAVRRSARTGAKTSTASTAAKMRSKVPVVPSTDHLHPADVAVSAFFAQHRPVSISHSVPLNHSETLFENIFASRKPAFERPIYQNSPSPTDFEHIDVVVESGWLESAIRSASNNAQQPQQQQQAAVAQPQTHQSTQDAADSANLGPDYFSYKPFCPPPPPRAQTAFLRPRLQKQLIQLLLQATTQGGGTVAISGNSKLLLENMIRQRRIGEAMPDENPGRVVMRLISVKRIRKLKMKKHKLKKLRKRTRSLRRRIESQRK